MAQNFSNSKPIKTIKYWHDFVFCVINCMAREIGHILKKQTKKKNTQEKKENGCCAHSILLKRVKWNLNHSLC